MIAQISPPGASMFGALLYNQQKVNAGKGEIIFCNNARLPKHDHAGLPMWACMEPFKRYLKPGIRTKYPVFHCSLNPHPDDALDKFDMATIAEEYMTGMGYGDQPYIVYLHKDIDREHMHIVSVRVDLKGTKLDHDFEGKNRSEPLTRQLEAKHGLHSCGSEQQQQAEARIKKVDYPKGNVKKQVASAVRTAIKNYRFGSIKELNAMLGTFNVYVEELKGETPDRQFNGIIYGALDDNLTPVGKPFKSSDMGRDVGHKALMRKCESANEWFKKEMPELRDLKGIIREAMQTETTLKGFAEKLADSAVQVIFRQNAEGRIYGVTFADHKCKLICNGSVLGKEFSANKFHELYGGIPGMNRGRLDLTDPERGREPAPLVPHGAVQEPGRTRELQPQLSPDQTLHSLSAGSERSLSLVPMLAATVEPEDGLPATPGSGLPPVKIQAPAAVYEPVSTPGLDGPGFDPDSLPLSGSTCPEPAPVWDDPKLNPDRLPLPQAPRTESVTVWDGPESDPEEPPLGESASSAKPPGDYPDAEPDTGVYAEPYRYIGLHDRPHDDPELEVGNPQDHRRPEELWTWDEDGNYVALSPKWEMSHRNDKGHDCDREHLRDHSRSDLIDALDVVGLALDMASQRPIHEEEFKLQKKKKKKRPKW